MFDRWTEKRWKTICASEDLTVGNFCLLVNSAGSLIEGEYKIEYLGVEIDFSGTFACEALLRCISIYVFAWNIARGVDDEECPQIHLVN